MKKSVLFVLSIVLIAALLAGCSSAKGNYTDVMKIPYGRDLSTEDGADSIERQGDHKDSPYFSQLDFYNMKSSETLTILSHFKTIQQTSEWSCGAACALMVLAYFDRTEGYSEEALAELRPAPSTPTDPENPFPAYLLNATSLPQMIGIFEAVGGFEISSTRDYGDSVYADFTLKTIREFLQGGQPILVCWNEWGGHWQVIIGYDTMGTEAENDDVLIMADPYDTTDHNQDGYVVHEAQRFYYNFTSYNFFEEQDGNDMLFAAVKPIV